MKRRDFLKIITAGIIAGGLAPGELLAGVGRILPSNLPVNSDEHVKDYLHKMQCFNQPHEEDVYLDLKSYRLLESALNRFKRLQQTVGHGNFNLLNFAHAVKIGRSYPRVGRFSREELDFLEMIFYDDSTLYGFFGEKPVKNLTSRIHRRNVIKIPYTGNYLYKGLPLETYKKIKQELGDEVVLTSGVRSIIKQFLLFLNKAYKSKGNLSLASRSLAPPGYSFHGIGDFDVGQAGLGSDNFTERFMTTEAYRKLKDLGYLKLRYSKDNLLGVRFEPWHIKVNSKA